MSQPVTLPELTEKLKGQGRPVNTLAKRINDLIKTGLPDYVFPLPEKFAITAEHEALIVLIRPDILAVSSHTDFLVNKTEIVKKYGGELRIVLPHNPSVSTSTLLQ